MALFDFLKKHRPIDDAKNTQVLLSFLSDLHTSFVLDDVTDKPDVIAKVAHSNPTVLASVEMVSTAISQLPYEIKFGNQRNANRFEKCFAAFPNQLKQIFLLYMLHGGVFVHTPKTSEVDGIVLPAASVDTTLDKKGKLESLVLNSSTQGKRSFKGNQLKEIFMFLNASPLGDPYKATPIASKIGKAIMVNNACYQWLESYYKKGASFGGIIAPADKEIDFDEKQAAAIKQQVLEASGAENAGNVITLLNFAMKYQQLGGNAREAMVINTLNDTTIQIAAAYGVPATLISAKGAQTYANQAEARAALYMNTVLPLTKNFCSMYSYHLSSLGFGKVTISVDEDQVPVLQDYLATRMQKWNSVNYLSVNEKRERFGYDPLTDDELGSLATNLPNADDGNDAPPEASPQPAPQPPSNDD